MVKISEKLFGTHSERELKRIKPLVDRIESLRPSMQALSDEQLDFIAGGRFLNANGDLGESCLSD